jgi:hypothetical protein
MKITDELLGERLCFTKVASSGNDTYSIIHRKYIVNEIVENKLDSTKQSLYLNGRKINAFDLNNKLFINGSQNTYSYFSCFKNKKWEIINSESVYVSTKDDQEFRDEKYIYPKEEFHKKILKYVNRTKNDIAKSSIDFFIKIYEADPTVGFTDKDIIKWKLLSL